jgi:hypothetical protein
LSCWISCISGISMTISGGIFQLQQVYNKRVSKTWPTTTFSFSTPITNLSSVNEPGSVVVTINTKNYENQTLYWTIQGVSGTVDSSDFTAISGSFTVEANNFGHFTVSTTEDDELEGVETFFIQIRKDSISGEIVANTNTITINDTSSSLPLIVEYLVLGGGGGGGGPGQVAGAAGGGGAGGLRSSLSTETVSGRGSALESSLTLIKNTNYVVTVGAGGNGGNQNVGSHAPASVFHTITSLGGQGGTAFIGTNNFGAGGSGGGGAGGPSADAAGGSGTVGQGYDGGSGANSPAVQNRRGGGGGGVGQAGSTGSGTSFGGTGGNGIQVTLLSSIYLGGGGGGGWVGRNFNPGLTASGSRSTGGLGGGGQGGATNPLLAGTAGETNTGGGGGGGSARSSPTALGYSSGGNGGSGRVVLRYSNVFTISNPGGGLTFSTTTSGSFKVTTFTAGTGNISFS